MKLCVFYFHPNVCHRMSAANTIAKDQKITTWNVYNLILKVSELKLWVNIVFRIIYVYFIFRLRFFIADHSLICMSELILQRGRKARFCFWSIFTSSAIKRGKLTSGLIFKLLTDWNKYLNICLTLLINIIIGKMFRLHFWIIIINVHYFKY